MNYHIEPFTRSIDTPAGVLRLDNRGRIRFSFLGYRFEVTKTTVTAYKRNRNDEWRVQMVPTALLANAKFVAKLHAAQEAIHES